MTSKAPIMFVTNWITLLKLSSPILQEPSMRKTRSALAPLHTVARKQRCLSKQQFRAIAMGLLKGNRLRYVQISSINHKYDKNPHHPAQEGLLQVREGLEAGLAPPWVWPLPDKAEKFAINGGDVTLLPRVPVKWRVLSSCRWAFQWHGQCYLTCPLLHADSRSLQVRGLGVHCGIVKGVGAQTSKAIVALRAPDSDLLGSALGGYSRDRDEFLV